jgi:hypothetical protein
MNFPPLPAHLTDAANRGLTRLWLAMEPVTAPLRTAGLYCDLDVRDDGRSAILVTLPGGSQLVITAPGGLPPSVDEAEAWTVDHVRHGGDPLDRQDEPRPQRVYNSSQHGRDRASGGDVSEMLQTTAQYCAFLPDKEEDRHIRDVGLALVAMLRAVVLEYAVRVREVAPGTAGQKAGGKGSYSYGPRGGHKFAVEEYRVEVAALTADGWTCVNDSGTEQWPVSQWEKDGATRYVSVVRVSHQ